MNTVVIVINKGGAVNDVLISSKIASNIDVEVIDFCTDDEDEYEWANERYRAIESELNSGKLKSLY